MGEFRERGRNPAREIARPVNGIALAAACDAAHVPLSLGRRAVAAKIIFIMTDTAGKSFVSPSAIGILMDFARHQAPAHTMEVRV